MIQQRATRVLTAYSEVLTDSRSGVRFSVFGSKSRSDARQIFAWRTAACRKPPPGLEAAPSATPYSPRDAGLSRSHAEHRS